MAVAHTRPAKNPEISEIPVSQKNARARKHTQYFGQDAVLSLLKRGGGGGGGGGGVRGGGGGGEEGLQRTELKKKTRARPASGGCIRQEPSGQPFSCSASLFHPDVTAAGACVCAYVCGFFEIFLSLFSLFFKEPFFLFFEPIFSFPLCSSFRLMEEEEEAIRPTSHPVYTEGGGEGGEGRGLGGARGLFDHVSEREHEGFERAGRQQHWVSSGDTEEEDWKTVSDLLGRRFGVTHGSQHAWQRVAAAHDQLATRDHPVRAGNRLAGDARGGDRQLEDETCHVPVEMLCPVSRYSVGCLRGYLVR